MKMKINHIILIMMMSLLTACGGGGNQDTNNQIVENHAKDDFVSELPALMINPKNPVSGQSVIVTVSVPSATYIGLSATGTGCSNFQSEQSNSNLLFQEFTVDNSGQCMFTAKVTTNGKDYTILDNIVITPLNIPIPEISIMGGIYKPSEDLKLQSESSGAPTISSVETSGNIINGGGGTYKISVSNVSNLMSIKQVMFKYEGMTGVFIVPVSIENEKIVFDILASQKLTFTDDINFIFQLIDNFGNYGNQYTQSVQTTSVASGLLQVSVSWNTETDVDLHVEEPNGNDIYYYNTISSSGGKLDLDSNPGCHIDGVNNENITYVKNSSTPIQGEYIVRVAYYSDCGGQSANYLVTVNNCGDIQTFSGIFYPENVDNSGSHSGKEITRISFSPCDKYRVAGRALYEDFPQTPSGLSNNSNNLPIRYAKVEVVQESDSSILATSITDNNGQFDIEFDKDGQAGYRVRIIAEQNNSTLKQKVINDNNEVYAIQSTLIDEAQINEKLDLEVIATRDTSAPAFNIFDMGVIGSSVIRERHNQTPPNLTWLWTNGKKGSCNSSCYQNNLSRITVLSINSDRDEYDDSVLLHEYGHFYQNNYSRSDSPGGSHSSNSRIVPTLAWGEGAATFFGNYTKGDSMYLDTRLDKPPFRLDIEQLSSDIPNGVTPTNTVDGNISEAVVAAIMWDLSDSSNEQPNGDLQPRDTISNANGVFGALGYLKQSNFVDRGFAGADLLDFVDGWFCKGFNNRGDSNTGVEGIVNGMHNFPYNYPNLKSCK